MSGFGFAGFAAGLSSGLNTGAKLAGMVEDYQLRKVREQGIAEAKALQAAASPQVQDNGDVNNLTSRPQASTDPNAPQSAAGQGILGILQQNAQPEQRPANAPEQAVGDLSATPQASKAPVQQPYESPRASGIQLAAPKRYSVGTQQFDDKGKADAAAKEQMPDIETFYAKTLVPRMRDKLLEMGRVDEAQAWEKYAEEKTTKQHMKTWSKAFAHAQGQDYMGAAQELMKLYPDYDDGFELVESKAQKGDNGQEGFLMKVRDADGNERTVFHDAKTITEVGLQQLQPIEMFQQRLKRQTQAEMLAAKEAADERNDLRGLGKSLATAFVNNGARRSMQEDRQEFQSQRDEKRHEQNKERDASKEAARTERLEKREQQRVEAEARKLASTVKKGDNPEKQYMAARAQVLKNPMSATMSAEEVDQEARNILDAAKRFATEAAPASSSAGQVANPVAQNKGIPVFRNGRIEYVTR